MCVYRCCTVAPVKVKTLWQVPCCHHLVRGLWETITHCWPSIKPVDGGLSLVQWKQTSPLCLITLSLLQRMVIWYWLGFMRAHRSSSLLFHRTIWMFVLPWVSWHCASCIISCYGTTAACALNVEWDSWLSCHIVRFLDKAIISHGPCGLSQKLSISLFLHFCLSPISLIVYLLVLGQQMCNDVVIGLFVINSSVIEREWEQQNSHTALHWKLVQRSLLSRT